MASSLSNLVNKLRKFIKSNVKMNMIIKNVKRTKLNTKSANAFFNAQTLKMIE